MLLRCLQGVALACLLPLSASAGLVEAIERGAWKPEA